MYWENESALRHTGFCPVCQRIWKVRGGLLVHHGYERPGTGYIHGDCFGVKRPPHELSPETAQDFLRRVVVPWVRNAEERVAELKREPAWMLFERYDPVKHEYVKVQLRRDEVFPDEWGRKIANLRRLAQDELDTALGEQKRLQLLVDTWEPRELGSVDEEIRKAEQSRAERKAIVEGKRAAVTAKKEAYATKEQERETRRRTLLEAFDAEFAALVDQPPGPEREEAALLLLQESRKKEHKLDYPHDWHKISAVNGFRETEQAIKVLSKLGMTAEKMTAFGHLASFPLDTHEIRARLKALKER